MKVILSPVVGFCYGVKRAVEGASSASKEGRAFSLGPLIHNPHVVSQLEKKGVKIISSLKDLLPGDLLIIPAQGATKSVYEEAETLNLRLLDLTCPELLRTRQLILQMVQENYQVLFLGDPGHSEVTSLLSYAPSALLLSEPQIPEGLAKKVAVFAQSTRDSEELVKLSSLLCPQVEELRVFNTICQATKQRQKALRDYLKDVDGVVVIGGKNSANSRRLASIAREKGKRIWYIEDALELNGKMFEDIGSLLVVSGASTPLEDVEKTVGKLRSF